MQVWPIIEQWGVRVYDSPLVTHSAMKHVYWRAEKQIGIPTILICWDRLTQSGRGGSQLKMLGR